MTGDLDSEPFDRFSPQSGTRYFFCGADTPHVPTTLHRIVLYVGGIDFEYWNGTSWEFSPLLLADRVNGGTEFTEIAAAEAADHLAGTKISN